MNLHKVLSLIVFVFALAMIPIAAQTEPAEDLAIEQESIRQKLDNGESHASGARDDLGPVILGNPTTAAVAIRVGLSYSFTATGTYSEFTTRHHPFAEISHTAGVVYLIDQSTRQEIAVLDVPGTKVYVTRSSAGYKVLVGGVEIGTFAGPIFFNPTDTANQFKIEHIRRTPTFGPAQQVPFYRGAIELSHGSGTTVDRLNVVNIVEIEDYVPGVVANESIASFRQDALKAQAVAARGYAIANIGRFRANFPYDIDDSTQSQVYRGVISEHVNAVSASLLTAGLVGSYDGKIIQALYSSSMGGHTENNEWVFNSPASSLPGTNALPYLRGVYDGTGAAPNLLDPATLLSFWTTTQPQTFDPCARTSLSRWKMNIPIATIKSRLSGRSTVVSGDTTGTVTGVEVTQRSAASQRIVRARVTLTSGIVDVIGWSNVRGVFGQPGTPAVAGICSATPVTTALGAITNPSVLEAYTASGAFAGVYSYGGGFGHNVGMSQYGAEGRARAGQTFLQILKGYYTGIDVGSYPIKIGREPGTGPPTLRHEFYVPLNTTGTLEIRNATLKGMNIHVNGIYDFTLRAEELSDGRESIDLTPYLVQGQLNVVQYNAVGRNGSATVNVNVQ